MYNNNYTELQPINQSWDQPQQKKDNTYRNIMIGGGLFVLAILGWILYSGNEEKKKKNEEKKKKNEETCPVGRELINGACHLKCPAGNERIDGVCVIKCPVGVERVNGICVVPVQSLPPDLALPTVTSSSNGINCPDGYIKNSRTGTCQKKSLGGIVLTVTDDVGIFTKKTDPTLAEDRLYTRSITQNNEFKVDNMGLRTWYINHPEILQKTQKTWDECQKACIENDDCQAFTRFHSTNPNGTESNRPCVLYKAQFDRENDVYIPSAPNWQGNVVNVTRS